MKSRSTLLFVILAILLISSEFIKDFFMLNINHVLKHLVKGYADFAHPSFYFLESWTIDQIMNLKWVLTIAFFFYFWILSYFTLKAYFGKQGITVKAISYLYIALIGAAGILYCSGQIFGIEKSMYHVVRTLTGLTHSFLPAMIAFLFLKYFPKDAVKSNS